MFLGSWVFSTLDSLTPVTINHWSSFFIQSHLVVFFITLVMKFMAFIFVAYVTHLKVNAQQYPDCHFCCLALQLRWLAWLLLRINFVSAMLYQLLISAKYKELLRDYCSNNTKGKKKKTDLWARVFEVS